MSARMVIGDVFDCLAATPDGSVDLILTSPPFLALRSYLPADHPDKAKEIGSEPDPATFIDTLLALSAEWRRVLAPHGSIAVELGDTYSGGSAEGSDTRSPESNRFRGWADGDLVSKSGPLWPEPKSLALVPESYRLALAYGRNPLTGTESPAGRWKVRNVVRWCRPNPPVGALGDKFRPATSDMVIACVSGKRYFDLDAVRTPTDSTNPGGLRKGTPQRARGGDERRADAGETANMSGSNPAGAPPLDWWEVSTEAYSGSHYATWPRKLLTRPILAMCPQRVCTVCGEPSRRITTGNESETGSAWGGGDNDGTGERRAGSNFTTATTTTLGWTDCGHGSYHCSSCHVLVPLDHALRGPREGQGSEAQVGAEALLGEPLEGANGQADYAGDLRGLRDRVPGTQGRPVLHPELFGEAGPHGGAGEPNPAGFRVTELERWPEDHRAGLRPGMGADVDPGTAEERLHDGASACDAGVDRPSAGGVGDRPPSQRGEGRQPDRESGNCHAGEARGDGGLPPLPGDLSGQLGGYVCPCGSTEVEYVANHWRNGIVLDPFAGSGTTLAVATGLGRDALGFDLDERNAALAMERVGMFLTVDHLERAS